MHPILHLAAQRHPEYRRGLTHSLSLAVEQLHHLMGCQPLITRSSLITLSHRLNAIITAIRLEAWQEADRLLRHETAPPIPADEHPASHPAQATLPQRNNKPQLALTP